MIDALKWLIGLRPLPSGASEGQWHLEFQSLPQGTTAIGLMVLAAVAVLGMFWLYKLEGRQLSVARRWGFVALRAMILGGVAIMLLDVVLVIERHEQITSHLVILMDSSESMSLTDPYADDPTAVKRMGGNLHWTGQDAAATLKKLRESKRYDLAVAAMDSRLGQLSDGRELSLMHFDSKAEPVESWSRLANIPPKGPQTAIGDALKAALAAHRSQPMAGVLLVTDGQSNGGEDARKIAEQAGKLARR